MRLEGTFHPRNYGVQYRESDFDFISRLLEEEGIFYFFRHAPDGQKDGNSSCWVRVGAVHAGNENGTIVVPRIGWEIVVSFLEGDPDRPMIIGSVYNPDHLPPADTRQ